MYLVTWTCVAEVCLTLIAFSLLVSNTHQTICEADRSTCGSIDKWRGLSIKNVPALYRQEQMGFDRTSGGSVGSVHRKHISTPQDVGATGE
jgi:hypothetical protein